jgi:hypothetical protein
MPPPFVKFNIIGNFYIYTEKEKRSIQIIKALFIPHHGVSRPLFLQEGPFGFPL